MSAVRMTSPSAETHEGWASVKRDFAAAEMTDELDMLHTSRTRESVVLTCCPPGPPDRENV